MKQECAALIPDHTVPQFHVVTMENSIQLVVYVNYWNGKVCSFPGVLKLLKTELISLIDDISGVDLVKDKVTEQ